MIFDFGELNGKKKVNMQSHSQPLCNTLTNDMMV